MIFYQFFHQIKKNRLKKNKHKFVFVFIFFLLRTFEAHSVFAQYKNKQIGHIYIHFTTLIHGLQTQLNLSSRY